MKYLEKTLALIVSCLPVVLTAKTSLAFSVSDDYSPRDSIWSRYYSTEPGDGYTYFGQI